MKRYIYKGLDNEKVPKDVTHVIVDRSVTAIKERAFEECRHLVSVIMGDNVKRIEVRAFYMCDHLVTMIMGDNVKRIEDHAFDGCYFLRFIRLSKTLEYIGEYAFYECRSLEALFLPSTVDEIEDRAFSECDSLILLILPHDVFGERIIDRTGIYQIVEDAGIFEWDENFDFEQCNCFVNEWLTRHMNEVPFHRLCYNTSITTNEINTYLNENSNNSVLAIDMFHGMIPLHILSMNPHAPADTIAALLAVNIEAVFCEDNQGKTSLDYAREYNVGGLLGMMNVLCNHRRAASEYSSSSKRKRGT